MIGQVQLLKDISRSVEQGTFPRFSIVVGVFGSEKNEIANFVATKLQANCIEVPDCKVDTIREIITSSYTVKSLTVYNIKDEDTMSVQARNALLKVTEEPPNKAYFIMTLENEDNTLPTIRSRGTVFRMQEYTQDQLTAYMKPYNLDRETEQTILRVCDTPGEVDLMISYKPMDFYLFVENTRDHIATVSGSNAFKLTQSIKFKDTDEKGYDLNLFWKAFCVVCLSEGYHNGLQLTSRYLSLLRVKTINRSMLFDMWILDLRKEWRDGSN